MVSVSILTEYDQSAQIHQACTYKISSLITELLDASSIRVHSVTHRMKARESLEKKLAKPDKHYQSLADITDVCGVRITTYFADDVDRVAKLIANHFSVDEENSVDRREKIKPEEFGYLSLHQIVSIDANRARLTEFQRYEGIKIEVQTRSILQHAWAEIEHDLGYKSEPDIPKPIRRQFSRLAGLLELVDEQFNEIRAALGQYESEISDLAQSTPELVPIDGATVRWFILNDALSIRMDEAICIMTGGAILEDYDISPALTGRLALLRLETIGALMKIAQDFYDETLALARKILPTTQLAMTGVPRGSGLFYLCYVVAAAVGDDALFYAIMTYMVDSPESSDAEAVAEAIAIMAREILASSGKLVAETGS